MDKPLDELYFVWLYTQVGDPAIKNPTRTYWKIFKQLFTKEFVWIVPNDDNRIEDGRDLRYEFVGDHALTNVARDWMRLGCSMLELLVGLSRRLAFEAEGEPRDWFWHLMDNLDLRQYHDKCKQEKSRIDEILDRIIWRTYEADGSGGLFPLQYAEKDQRKVEIWYQLNAYILEMS